MPRQGIGESEIWRDLDDAMRVEACLEWPETRAGLVWPRAGRMSCRPSGMIAAVRSTHTLAWQVWPAQQSNN